MLALQDAGAIQLLKALRKQLWAKTLFRLWIKAYGCAFLGVALTYLLAKKKDIKGKTVLITGGAMGLGKAMAAEFARNGAKRVVLWDINQEALAATKAELSQATPQVEILTSAVDISKKEAVYAAADELNAATGFVDIVVGNAGILGGKAILDQDDRRIQMLMDVNLMSLFWLTKKFLPPMLAKNDGHIITVASCAAFFPSAFTVDYTASKAAAKGFTDGLRMELLALRKTGVKTLCVCPAGMKTALFKGLSVPGMPSMAPEYVAKQVINYVKWKSELLVISPFRMAHAGLINQALMPVWWMDFCSGTTLDSIAKVDLSQANAVFDKMEAARKV
jgi:all-trans-retinol dehydrogenase (NAD+)